MPLLLAAQPRFARARSRQQITATSPALPSPFEVQLASDLPITLVGLLTMFRPDLFLDEEPTRSPSIYLRSRVNRLDRSVIGNRNERAASASDALLYASLGLPFAASVIEALVSPDGLVGLGRDSLVLLETLAVTSLICKVVKYSSRRARPYMYDPVTPEEDRRQSKATQSFFSGHTATSFAMATAYSYLFTLRHPGSKAVIPVWLTTHALAATTAALRVKAGRHFWSDVLVGAAMGSAVGILVPWLHRKVLGGRSLISEANPLARVRLAPTFPEKGFGLSALMFW